MSVNIKVWTLSSLHQQNVSWFGSHTQSPQTLGVTSPVLLSTSRCSQTPLELSKVLSDSARAFSGAPERTCSYGGAFRMLRDLTYRIVQFWSSWDLCAYLRETLRDAVPLCGIHREQPRPQCCSAGELVLYSHSGCSYITTRHFILLYSSLLQSQDSLHHNMPCIILVCLYIYILSIWPQMVLEHNRSSTWTRPLREHLEMHHLEAIVVKQWS